MRTWVPNDAALLLPEFRLASFPLMILELGGGVFLRIRNDGRLLYYKAPKDPEAGAFDVFEAEEGK